MSVNIGPYKLSSYFFLIPFHLIQYILKVSEAVLKVT